MNVRFAKQSLRRSYGAIAIAASVLAPHVAWCRPSTVGTMGVVEITEPSKSARCEPGDTQLERSRKHVDDSQAAADAARARLVRAHLRMTEYPGALLHAILDEENFEAERAELHEAEREAAQAESQLAVTGCDTTAAEQRDHQVQRGVEVAVRMELPATYLQPLRQALRAGPDSVVAYAELNGATINGELISVESAAIAGEQIVIARAHLRDPRHRLRDGEIVGVAVRLTAPL